MKKTILQGVFIVMFVLGIIIMTSSVGMGANHGAHGVYDIDADTCTALATHMYLLLGAVLSLLGGYGFIQSVNAILNGASQKKDSKE